MKSCHTSKEGFAMALTCFLDELGIKDINIPKVRNMLERTCLPYKSDGTFLVQWAKRGKIYIHACRDILDGNAKKTEKHGHWIEKAKDTTNNVDDMDQIFQALQTMPMTPKLSKEDFERLTNGVRSRLMLLAGRL